MLMLYNTREICIGCYNLQLKFFLHFYPDYPPRLNTIGSVTVFKNLRQGGSGDE